eukprot:PhF_6_TR8530/c0_g1_i2/m.13367
MIVLITKLFFLLVVINAEVDVKVKNVPDLPVVVTPDLYSYGIPIRIGSKLQSFVVMVDSGSQALWIASSNSTPSWNNTFDPSSSSTFVSLNKQVNLRYGSGSVDVLLGKDTVCVGVSCAPSVTFGVGTKFTTGSKGPFDGILGLKQKADTYQIPMDLLLMQMIGAASTIVTPDYEVDFASLRFAYNETTPQGTGWNEVDVDQSQNPYDWVIPVQYPGSTTVESVLVDTGTSLNFLPPAFVNKINTQLGCIQQHRGLCQLPADVCQDISKIPNVTVAFTLGKAKTYDVKITGLDNVIRTCDSSGKCTCYSGYVPGGNLLGDPFFRAFNVFFKYGSSSSLFLQPAK